MMHESITLRELNTRIANLITTDCGTQNVWVTAELSDVAVRRGHCYMELLQKDEMGNQLAKARGVIWAGQFARLSSNFVAATGQQFATGIKLMVRASATMHPVFGLSLVITELDPNYTMGDLLRRRREIIERLTREGVIDDNRNLDWPSVANRIAVISAPGAAGYGDFINQLMNNPYRLKFFPGFFPATMQGDTAASSIIASLNRVVAEDCWDCVVIIRGGGATSDLQCFENYELALNIAQFPIPVIIGIGHERDVTLLDSVANMRVKTPTAAAEWLVSRGRQALDSLDMMAQTILAGVSEIVSGRKEELSYYQGLLPVAPREALQRATLRLGRAGVALSGVSGRMLSPARSRLDVMASRLSNSITTLLSRRRDMLDSTARLVDALSPQAVLNRGYSITRFDGHAVTDSSVLPDGAVIETTLASGRVLSRVENKIKQEK